MWVQDSTITEPVEGVHIIDSLGARVPTVGYNLVVVDLDGDLRDPVGIIGELLKDNGVPQSLVYCIAHSWI